MDCRRLHIGRFVLFAALFSATAFSCDFLTPATPPTAPTELAITQTDSDSIHLIWRDNSSDETEFVVQRRSEGSTSFLRRGSVGAGVIEYFDDGLEAGVAYEFRIAAVNGAGETYSETAAITLAFDFIPAGWSLVWHDEFNGTGIDPANWVFETGAGGWGNNEIQYYTNRSENARIIADGGNSVLCIEARSESFSGSGFTSARMKTQGLQYWNHGRIEARMRLPSGDAVWPAFWMLGESIGSGVNWPACGEIDIMELRGDIPNRVGAALHYSNASNTHSYVSSSYTLAAGFQNDYHVFMLEWDSTSASFFVDGSEYYTQQITDAERTEFVGKNFFIILNLAVGGPDTLYTGKLAAVPANFPQQLLVDWVRVYTPE